MKDAIIIDTETHSKDNPIPIEIAYINPVTGETYCERFNPGVPITLGALATHNILDEELVDCRHISEFKVPDNVGYFIAHNCSFDYGALGKPEWIKQICTLAIARKYLPELDSHTQSALMYHYFRYEAKELLREAHSALADVTNLQMVLTAMRKANVFPKCNSWEEMFLLSEDAKTPDRWTFGKHRGKPLADAPCDYIKWYLKLPVSETDSYLVKALKSL